MSNSNSFNGFYNLPAQVISGTSETALLVPAAGTWAGYPSPVFAAGGVLFAAVPPDITGNMAVDGHSFIVRIAGKVNTGASSTFTAKLYVGSATSALGTSAQIATSGAITAFTGAGNFFLEARGIWDSTSTKLGGYFSGASTTVTNGTALISFAALSNVQTIASVAGMQFMAGFTFGTGNAANSVTITEFVLDRD